MARKPALSLEKLTDLPLEKLARLVLEEAERNAGFRRQVKAALAAKDGPQGVVKLIDRRLAGLERAKSFIEWDKARAFRDDLSSLLDTIINELTPAAPDLAMDRVIRFIATHERVFDRVDDSYGYVQGVYYQAIAHAGEIAAKLNATEAALLPEKIMARLGESSHGYLVDLTSSVAPQLPQPVLERWDADLGKEIEKRKAKEAKKSNDRWFYSITSQWSQMRQIIAIERGDLDLLVALESAKAPHTQDVLDIAERLLEGGRAAEALDWVRKPGSRSKGQDNPMSPKKIALEARILEALEDHPAAQTLRWQCFEETLSADILRAYLKKLPDFEDMEAEERAMELGLAHSSPNAALDFYLEWPRLDLAAQIVCKNYSLWNGGRWHYLPDVAQTLEHDYPQAATILYRALLDDILERARSKAYGYGAKYLAKLTLLAKDADPELPGNRPNRPERVYMIIWVKKAGLFGWFNGQFCFVDGTT